MRRAPWLFRKRNSTSFLPTYKKFSFKMEKHSCKNLPGSVVKTMQKPLQYFNKMVLPLLIHRHRKRRNVTMKSEKKAGGYLLGHYIPKISFSVLSKLWLNTVQAHTQNDS